jgi:DegV family protein with EDD domain
MENKVAIMVDSGCAPTQKLIKNNNLEFIGIRINLDNDQYEDGVTLTKDQFYHRIGRVRDFSTEPPSPKEVLDKYRAIQAKGYEKIIDIHLSSKMTELVKNSEIASGFAIGMDVHIIDTQSVSAPAYFTADKIIELLQRGLEIDEIKPLLPEIISSSLMQISASTLKYFVKNGRIGKAQGLVGSLMQVKPILTIEDGQVAPFAKERGIESAAQTMADHAFNFIADRRHNVKIYAAYGSEKNSKYLQIAYDAFMEKFQTLNIRNYEIVNGRGWPTVTCHSGPEVFALSVYGEATPI